VGCRHVKQEESEEENGDGEMELILKILKIISNVWKVLEINLKPGRLLFPCVLLESFKNFLANPYYEPLLWFMIFSCFDCIT